MELSRRESIAVTARQHQVALIRVAFFLLSLVCSFSLLRLSCPALQALLITQINTDKDTVAVCVCAALQTL